MNEEIFGGMKNALDRGETLKEAMMSFFNAGYDRKEIEEVAAALLNYSTTKSEIPVVEPFNQIGNKDADKKEIPKPVQKISQYGDESALVSQLTPIIQKEISEGLQKITPSIVKQFTPKELPGSPLESLSNATSKGTKKKTSKMSSSEKVIVAILVGLLIFLIGILAVIFLFRQQLIDFVSTFVT